MACVDDTYWARRKRREDDFAALVVMVSDLPTDIIVCILSHLDRMRAMTLSRSCGSIRRAAMTPSLWELVRIHQIDTCRWIIGVPWPLVRNVIISHGEDDESDVPVAARDIVRYRRTSHVQFYFEGFWILPFDSFHCAFDSGRVTFESLELELENLRVARTEMNWALISPACGDITVKTYMDEEEYDELDFGELDEWLHTTVAENDALTTLSIRVQYSYWNGGRERMDQDWFEMSSVAM